MPKDIHPSLEAENFGKRLQSVLEAAGQPRRGAGSYLAKRYKVANVTANAWLNGAHKADADIARQIAEDHGVSFESLYLGPGRIVDLAGTGEVSVRPFLRPITIWDDAEDLPPDQFVFFPSLEYRWSCGNGGPDHNQVEETDKSISFTAEWARKMGWSPKTHLTMRAAGESMEPTIQDKAPVVIDTSEAGRAVKSGKVYAIKVNGEPLLKRLDRLPGGRLRVRADNPSPAYAAFEVADGEIEIVGRAVWTPVNL